MRLLFLLLTSLSLPLAAPAAWDIQPDTWAATDGLGRTMPLAAETGPVKSGRTVGMFYFLWNEGQNPVYDISRLTAADPDHPRWGPRSAFHHWGEPLFGYYRQDDRAVVRKHLQMLTNAGVDMLLLDVTNALTYDDKRDILCEEIEARAATGQRVPTIAFLTNSRAGQTVEHLYRTFYQPGKFRQCWAQWLGKPLLLAPPEELPDEIRSFFTIRQSWAWTRGHAWFGDGRDKWPWLDHTPQTPGWTESPDKPEQISVTTAEHPVSNIGRSFHDRKQPAPADSRSGEGLYFAEQWKRALEVDPPFVLVTGWNEWVAQRFISTNTQPFLGGRVKAGETYFVDQYNAEFSRDIEPMKGGFGDAYYYQLAAAVRRYKGTASLPPVTAAPVTVDGDFADWKAAAPEYRDTLADPVWRKHPGWPGQPDFLNESGRNDLAAAKVSADTAAVYFYARTRAPLTEPGTRWMQLLLDSDNNPATGWLGYDFLINGQPLTGTAASVERLAPDGASAPGGFTAPLRWRNNELELSLPRAALGLSAEPVLLFKWTDNIPLGGDATAFTLDGDAAPDDRFSYRAVLPPAP